MANKRVEADFHGHHTNRKSKRANLRPPEVDDSLSRSLEDEVLVPPVYHPLSQKILKAAVGTKQDILDRIQYQFDLYLKLRRTNQLTQPWRDYGIKHAAEIEQHIATRLIDKTRHTR